MEKKWVFNVIFMKVFFLYLLHFFRKDKEYNIHWKKNG